jgi:hypothetical protein
MDQQHTQYYYQQNTAPYQCHVDTYRINAQSPTPVIYQQQMQQPMQQVRAVNVTQPPQNIQQHVQPHPQCICQQSQYQPQNATSQNRDIGDIVTSVIGEEKMKETMKDEEIKMLKAQLELLDTKLSDMIAKQVKRFCF